MPLLLKLLISSLIRRSFLRYLVQPLRIMQSWGMPTRNCTFFIWEFTNQRQTLIIALLGQRRIPAIAFFD